MPRTANAEARPCTCNSWSSLGQRHPHPRGRPRPQTHSTRPTTLPFPQLVPSYPPPYPPRSAAPCSGSATRPRPARDPPRRAGAGACRARAAPHRTASPRTGSELGGERAVGRRQTGAAARGLGRSGAHAARHTSLTPAPAEASLAPAGSSRLQLQPVGRRSWQRSLAAAGGRDEVHCETDAAPAESLRRCHREMNVHIDSECPAPRRLRLPLTH